MLHTQEFLRRRDLAALTAELGIKVFQHPTLPLVGLTYDQIESPKTHPIVAECRGLVLERDSWAVVAKGFNRFFNAGEDEATFKQFDWSDFTTATKEDGSLILVYHYAGEWHVNTRGSFGLGECGFSGQSWREVFWSVANFSLAGLCKHSTYVFELCTPHNKVVRVYPKPSVFLLSVFCNLTGVEMSPAAYERELEAMPGVLRPKSYHFRSMDEIAVFLKRMEGEDKTFEGVVVRDRENRRFKLKSKTYLALHHLKDNGNIFNPKRMVPLVLNGEIAEVIAYLPECEAFAKEMAERLETEYAVLRSVWEATKAIPTQKDFAQAVVPATPFASVLFNLRKKHGTESAESDLRSAWFESDELIVRKLFA